MAGARSVQRAVRGGTAGGERRGITVADSVSMADDATPHSAGPEVPDGRMHQFTVQRGMAVVLVIETTFWYSGLLQAALARVTLEGQN